MFQLANGTFVPEEPTPADLFALLDDEYARAILAATSEQATSAPALAEACDASHPTIYRRIDRLKNQNLLAERTEPESRWTPPRVYAARFGGLTVDLDDGEFGIEVDREEDTADRFTRLWRDLR